ncbi:MAG TPA: ROK family protein [bacterium]|nr:ROK family protein [bacterium]
MVKKQKDMRVDKICAVDIGNAFCKIGVFEEADAGIRPYGFQILPVLEQGLFLDPEIGGRDQTGFSLAELARSTGDTQAPWKHIVATTTRLPMPHVAIGGLTNDAIDDFLAFASQVGLEVEAVMTDKGILWANGSSGTFAQIDAVILVGGFDRKKETKLLKVAESVASELKHGSTDIPVLYIGCAELLVKIQHIFAGERQVFLFEELWPGKKQRDFLPLFIHLQNLAVQKAEREDRFISQLSRQNGITVDSGYSAMLAALAVLTAKWNSNVLLVDIGSDKSLACWSFHHDSYALPVWRAEELRAVLFQGNDASEESESLFGFKLFRDLGLGHSVETALKQVGGDDLALLWEGKGTQNFLDRILNHGLYPSTIPDEADLRWQEQLVRGILEKIWKSLPTHFNPQHIVLSGACFGSGNRLSRLIENVWLTAPPPFSASIWLNNGPYLGVLGSMAKLDIDFTDFDDSALLLYLGDYVRIFPRKGKKPIKVKVKVELTGEQTAEHTIESDSQLVTWEAGKKAVVTVQPLGKCRVAGYEPGEEVILRTSSGCLGLIIDAR